MAMELSGITERIWAKRLNFTIVYGAGPKGIFAKNKKSFKTLENTIAIYNKYHEGMPFVRATCDAISNEARVRGYVVSIGGRVHHKPKPQYDVETGRWNDGLYKMTNYKIQGLASDTLKRGLVDAYEVGLLDILKLHATVHDENVLSIPYTIEGIQAAQEFQMCMENAYKDRWTVPIRTSGDVGPSWGYQKDDIWLEMKKDRFDFDKYRQYVREN
jgi:DNA polymerase I-like protein with 3'-5' exonuclease and polymerase domains